jgi:uncharacterized protein (DUF433 family)
MDKNYVRLDEHGVYRVGATRVTLDGVVLSFKEGCTPETIIQQYRALSLEDVYGAIAYYLAHKGDVEEYLKKQDEEWERLRAEQDANPPPVVQRLRELKKARDQAKT